MRLKAIDKVIGYTLTFVSDDAGQVVGAAMFFKDLTRVEQFEERERLRDRLAAVGEMAAAIAHEVKNPLAGIEVMAGLLRRKMADSPDAQAMLDGHHQRSQDGELDRRREVLDFVRPMRLRVEHTGDRAGAVQGGLDGREQGAARRRLCGRSRCPKTCRRFRATSISSLRCSPTC